MGIPAPRIDYNSLATPGGVGQGLAALGDSVIRARIARNKADQDAQGLARMEKRDSMLAAQNAARLEEDGRHNRAVEATQQQELGLRGLSTFGAGVKNVTSAIGGGLSKMMDPTAQARVRYLDSMTQKNLRQPEQKIPEVGEAAYSVARRALADQEAALQGEARTNPDFQEVPGMTRWNAVTPAKRNLQTELQQLRETSDDAKIVREYMRQMEEHAKARTAKAAVPPGGPNGPGGAQAPAPATVIPAGAGSIRKRVTQLYGGAIDADLEASIAEAEMGDAESLQQLEELFAPVAQPEEPDLLGNPR
jgi:hypothetical protein